jgi:hypothetical protein
MAGLEKQDVTDKRRPTRRKKVLLRGVITTAPGNRSFDCSILNLSESGAQISLSHNLELPHIFYLINIRDRCAYGAVVAWRKQDNAGVTFFSQFNLNEIPDPGMRFLRRLWLEAAVQ